MTKSKVFKAFLTDGPNRLRDASLAQRTLVSTFHGKAFIAEREGDELRVYLVSGGDNIGTGTFGDKKSTGMTAATLQRQNEKLRQAEAAAR